MDIKVERDYSLWRVTALTLRGRAVMDALEIPDGGTVYELGYLKLLEAAQAAGLEVQSA